MRMCSHLLQLDNMVVILLRLKATQGPQLNLKLRLKSQSRTSAHQGYRVCVLGHSTQNETRNAAGESHRAATRSAWVNRAYELQPSFKKDDPTRAKPN